MENGRIALTAVYLKLDAEYFGFIEELPAMNSRGRSLDEARAALQSLAAESVRGRAAHGRRDASAGGVVREAFFLPRPGKASD